MTEDTHTPAPSEPVAGPVQRPVRPLLDDWAEAAGHWFFDTGHGLATGCTVLRSDLEQLVNAAAAQERARYTELFQAYNEACADGALARREVDAALPAMRIYARDNPPHEYEGATQDPHGVHAWLARNDRA